MLIVTIPQDGASHLTFSSFEGYNLPAPIDGADAEINDTLVLKFEDEEEAIIYATQLENMADEINDKTTTQYLAINDIIAAIKSDEFVQRYTK